jgi:hypothetical protein
MHRQPACALPLAIAFILLTTPSPVLAGYIINVAEVGGDVVASGTGTINLTALTLDIYSPELAPPGVTPFQALISTGSTNLALIDFYDGITGPVTFGPGFGTASTSATGDIFLVGGELPNPGLGVPPGYSGGTLTSTSTWVGTTINGLGMTPGTYTWTWGTGPNADSLTLNIGQVPEPSTVSLLGIGMAGIAGGRWLRRKRIPNKVPA